MTNEPKTTTQTQGQTNYARPATPFLNSVKNNAVNQPQEIKRVLFIIGIIFALLSIAVVSSYIYMKLNSYNFFTIDIPNKDPMGFKRLSIVKKIPPEKDWYFIVTYENSKKQQIIFNYEPERVIRCEGGFWQQNLSVFKPIGSSEGCSFYMDEYKNKITPVRLHWFLWNKGGKTHHIYDQESTLSNKEAMNIANSVRQNLVIAQDLTQKNE